MNAGSLLGVEDEERRVVVKVGWRGEEEVNCHLGVILVTQIFQQI
jgi:hypothetical protein